MGPLHYREIGQLKLKLDWLKKSAPHLKEKRSLVDIGHTQISLERQCDLLGLCRST